MNQNLSQHGAVAEAGSIIVIGAGIIGVTAALRLLADGHSVTLLDRGDVAGETSGGNAGAFAFSDIEPLAAPGILRKAPGWLLDPLGPLSLRPAYAVRMMPWLLHFWRSSQPKRHLASIAAQARMMDLSRRATETLIDSVDGQALIRREGQLQVYEGAGEYRESLSAWDLRRQHGVAFRLLESAGDIAEIQPGLSPRFTHAGFTPDWMNVTDPKVWTEHLARCFVNAGGQIRQAEVREMVQGDAGVSLMTDGETLTAGQVVLAAGAWSHRLARTLGERIPLETERGYNTTFPVCDFDLRTHVTFPGHGFVVSRVGQGVWIGGAVELGGLNLAPNFDRSDVLVRKARAFLPGFDPQDGTRWMGFRPSMPDSLPAIGRSGRADRVIHAFGHGHLGLTQSAGTAEIVAAIAARRAPDIDISAFDPLRFSRR
ncbi:MAG: NAD(P)/FAD-dependent oxidoreductase [Marinibacterium profundimaris]